MSIIAMALLAEFVLALVVTIFCLQRHGTTITVQHPDRFYCGMRIDTGDGRRWTVSAINGNAVTVKRS
jgi:hypothetical protein